MDLDALDCPRCHDRMELIATIEEPAVIRKILRAMGLPEEAPGPAPAMRGFQIGEGRRFMAAFSVPTQP